jgi:hypothetical protein
MYVYVYMSIYMCTYMYMPTGRVEGLGFRL